MLQNWKYLEVYVHLPGKTVSCSILSSGGRTVIIIQLQFMSETWKNRTVYSSTHIGCIEQKKMGLLHLVVSSIGLHIMQATPAEAASGVPFFFDFFFLMRVVTSSWRF